MQQQSQSGLTIEPYSDQSFAVRGGLTRNYTAQLKKLGGKYNPNLRGGPGWIFSNRARADADQLVNAINSGQIPPSAPSPTYSPNRGRGFPPQGVAAQGVASQGVQGATSQFRQLAINTPSPATAAPSGPPSPSPITLPTITPVQQMGVPTLQNYQTVTYTVIKPQVGMLVNINVRGCTLSYQVVTIEDHAGIIDGAYIRQQNIPNGPLSKLVITNGQWQVLGMIESHTVNFS
jgi:hypothetical protein